MLNISINLETGVASLSQTTAMKAGFGVPARITFSANPGASPTIELALSAQSSSPSVLAFLDEWEAQSSTVYTGTLDANDTRLITHLVGKQQQQLDCEIVLTVGGDRRGFPNFAITTQPPIITGPETSEGGPVYLTETLGDARYPGLGTIYGHLRITANGLEIRDTVTNVWRRITFADGQLTFTQL